MLCLPGRKTVKKRGKRFLTISRAPHGARDVFIFGSFSGKEYSLRAGKGIRPAFIKCRDLVKKLGSLAAGQIFRRC